MGGHSFSEYKGGEKKGEDKEGWEERLGGEEG